MVKLCGRGYPNPFPVEWLVMSCTTDFLTLHVQAFVRPWSELYNVPGHSAFTPELFSFAAETSSSGRTRSLSYMRQFKNGCMPHSLLRYQCLVLLSVSVLANADSCIN